MAGRKVGLRRGRTLRRFDSLCAICGARYARVVLALAVLGIACGRAGPEGEEGEGRGDSIEALAGASADESGGTGSDTAFLSLDGEPTAVAAGCLTESLDAERIELTAAWEGNHVRVTGRVEGGAGAALNLGLSHGEQFIYSEVFKSDLLNVIMLESDSVDLTSVSYEPSASERAAFARTGAGSLDPARPVCLDVSLYAKASLDLLAARHLPVSGAPGARRVEE